MIKDDGVKMIQEYRVVLGNDEILQLILLLLVVVVAAAVSVMLCCIEYMDTECDFE